MKSASLIFAIIVLILGPSVALAQDAEAVQRTYQKELDAAVDRGLAYLASKQVNQQTAQQLGRPELVGSFLEESSPGNTGITSLAVMAFLAKGHLPGRGPYGAVINRGIDYLLKQQLDIGLLVCRNTAGRTTGLMYEHSIATLLLGEVSGMVDSRRQNRIDSVLPKAAGGVRILFAARFRFLGSAYPGNQ